MEAGTIGKYVFGRAVGEQHAGGGIDQQRCLTESVEQLGRGGSAHIDLGEPQVQPQGALQVMDQSSKQPFLLPAERALVGGTKE